MIQSPSDSKSPQQALRVEKEIEVSAQPSLTLAANMLTGCVSLLLVA